MIREIKTVTNAVQVHETNILCNIHSKIHTYLPCVHGILHAGNAPSSKHHKDVKFNSSLPQVSIMHCCLYISSCEENVKYYSY
jgi:hypothetical protein